ncbi:MAG: hypothetical protein HC910_22520, partial [Spirulinaceae cyanobacterium SM2_1_0]|nr:hypothetical protein [Spirulinaceae cyanobacterium SM2_1_0]
MQSSLAAQFEILNSAVSGLRTEFGESIAPLIAPLLGEITGFLNNATDLLANSGFASGLASLFDGAVGGLSAALSAIDFSFLQEIAGFLQEAFTDALAALQGSDILPLLGNLTEELGRVGSTAAEALGGTASGAFGSLVQIVENVVSALTNAIEIGNDLGIFEAAFNGIQVAAAAFYRIQLLVSQAISAVSDGLSFASERGQRLLTILQPGFQALGIILKPFIASIQFAAQLLGTGLGNAVGGVIGTFRVLNGVVEAVFNFIEPLAIKLAEVLDGIGSGVDNALRGTLNFIREQLNQIFELANKIPGVNIPPLEIQPPSLPDESELTLDTDKIDRNLERAKSIYRDKLKELGDAAETEAGQIEIQRALEEAGLGDFDIPSLSEAVDAQEFADIAKEVQALERAGQIIQQKTAELGDAAATGWGQAQIRSALAAEGYGDAQLDEIERASTGIGRAQLTVLKAIENLGEGASEAQRRAAAETAIAAGEFGDVPEAELQKTVDGIVAQSIALEQASAEAGKAAAEGTEEGADALEQALAKVRETATEQNLAIQQALNAGTIDEDEAATRRADAAIAAAQAELDALEANGADRQAILDAQLALEEARGDKRQSLLDAEKAAEEKAVQKIADAREKAQADIVASEQQRLIEIERLLADGAIDEDGAERLRADAAREAIQDELAAEQDRLAALEALAPADGDAEAKRQQEIRAARAATTQLTLDLLQAERSAQEALQQAEIDAIQRAAAEQARAIDAQISGIDRLSAQLEQQQQRYQAIEQSLQNQTNLLNSQAQLEEAKASLVQTQLNADVDRASRAQEIVQRLREGVESSEIEQQLQQELAELGFKRGATELDIVRQRQDAEQARAEQERQDALGALDRQKQLLQLENARSAAAAQRAVIEARIAQNQAQQAALQAQSEAQQAAADLQTAQVEGDAEAIAAAEAELAAKQQGAELAQQAIGFAAENVAASEEGVAVQEQLNRQGLE